MKKLSLKKQGEFCFEISRHNEPRLEIGNGETFVVETEDAFSGQIRKASNRRDLEARPFGNPLSGPVFVKDATKNDTLSVRINSIRPTIGQGATRIVSWSYGSGPLAARVELLLGGEAPHGTAICPIRDKVVHFKRWVLPYAPFIGTVGTAPQIDAVRSTLPGSHGGNMDLPEIGVGNVLHLPVYVDGALLHLGDVHAAQGDAEFAGAAVEMPAAVSLTVNIMKNRKIERPRIDSGDRIFAVASTFVGRPLEDTIRLAFLDLIDWLESDYGFERWEAFQICGMVASLRIGNIWTVAAGFPKKYLKP